MKKLIMFIAAASLAGSLSAASVNWTATGLTDYKSQTFYLFAPSASSDVLAALAAVDDTTADTLAGLALATGTVTTKGKASATGVDVGSSTSVMVLVLGGDIAADTGYIYKTEDVSSMLYTPPASAPGNFSSAVATSGTTGTMVGSGGGGGGGDVPEPTSGLLLLVGGAMLALRRKQK